MMNRIVEIRDAINKAGLDAVILFDYYNRRFATAFPSSDGAVVVTSEKAYYITDSRYIEAAQNSIEEAEVLDVVTAGKYPEMIKSILSDAGAERVGFEDFSMSYRSYRTYADYLDAQLVPAQDILRKLRSVKTADEVALLQRAQDITDETFSEVLKVINGDITERELAAELVYRMMRLGGDKESFDPIVVSGPNSSRPHGVPGDRKLEGFVTMDFGCMYRGYCSDMTRTVCVGTATEEMKAVYNTVLEAQLAGIAAAKADVIGESIDKAARDVINNAGYGDYFGHGFGHSVGLEVHDGPGASPSNENTLPAGYVVSAEPGIYIPGRFGVRIEDVIVLTRSGHINLTKSPKHLIEL